MGEKLHFVEKEFEPLLIFSVDEALKRYSRELNNDNALFLLAEENNKAIGYLYSHTDKIAYLDTKQPECVIEAIYIEKEFRGKGLVKLLVEQTISWAKSKNVFRIRAGIYAKNTFSQSAFLKLGFIPHHTTYVVG